MQAHQLTRPDGLGQKSKNPQQDALWSWLLAEQQLDGWNGKRLASYLARPHSNLWGLRAVPNVQLPHQTPPSYTALFTFAMLTVSLGHFFF